MLVHETAFSSFSVDDVAKARDFYRDVLGVDVVAEMGGLLRLRLAGGQQALVYPKPDHVPAAFTILNFVVSDVERAVAELADAGVQMLRYEGFGQDERGISRNPGGPPIAWFEDPAGNILAVLEG